MNKISKPRLTGIPVLVFILMAVTGAAPVFAGTESYEQIEIAGEKAAQGIFDPSLEYGPDGTLWMSYSAIEMPRVSVRLAKSADGGKTWTMVRSLSESYYDKTVADKKLQEGVWHQEVSSLVYDPDDPGKEWKVFYHKFFNKKPYGEENKRHAVGYIAYRYAHTPEGKWSEEAVLFGMGPFAKQGIDLRKLHSDLWLLKSYSEPGALYKDGVLYMSLDASMIPDGLGAILGRKIILVASKDHGKTWKYVGTLTTQKDAEKFKFTIFTASSLVQEDGKPYLLVAAGGPKDPQKNAYDGMYVFEFEDISKGKLKRDGSKKLVLVKTVYKLFKELGGQGDYDEHARGGIVVSQANLKNLPKVGELYHTKEKIVQAGNG